MGKKNTSTPDNSAAIQAMAEMNAAAMTHQSDNMFNLGMAQIGSQMMQSEAMFTLGQSQIDAQLSLGRKELRTSLEIARLNYLEHMNSQEDRHLEKMGEQDLRRYEIDKQAEADARAAGVSTGAWSAV